MARRHLPFIGLMLGVVSVSGLQGQDIPRNLALRLLGEGFSSTRTTRSIHVQSAPADFDTRFLPPAATVIGSLERGQTVSVIVSVPGEAAAIIDALVEDFLAEGWRAPETDPRGGFRPAAPGTGTWVCHDEIGQLGYTATTDGTHVRVTHRKEIENSRCDIRLRRYEPDLSFPAMRLPPGVELRGSSGSGGSGFMEYSARLATDLTLEEVFAHVGPELEAAGWTPRSPVDGSAVVAQRWQDDQGRAALLFGFRALEPDPDEFLVTLRLGERRR